MNTTQKGSENQDFVQTGKPLLFGYQEREVSFRSEDISRTHIWDQEQFAFDFNIR
jgi:hypothetical protein